MTAADAKYSFDLQANPPLPGSVAALEPVPGDRVDAGALEVQAPDEPEDAGRPRLRLPRLGPLLVDRAERHVPDARPRGRGHRHGAVQARRQVRPEHRAHVVRNPNFWKKGLPYLDSIQYRIITDEQSRVAALRAGAIHGATVSADSAAALNGANGLTVLNGLNAAFRELQFTIKQGETKPWHDKRVRQAVSFAINRQNIIDKVYGGFGQYSGHVPPGYGPWPLSQDELKTKYEKYDVPEGQGADEGGGQLKGFDVTMTTFSTPLDYAAMAALIKSDLAQIGINVNIVAAGLGHVRRAGTAPATFEWDLTGRGMRGDVDGYVNEYHPASASVPGVVPRATRANTKMFRLIGNGRIVLDAEEAAADVPGAQQGPDGRDARGAADLVLEVPGRQQQAEEHVRRVLGLQPRAAHRVPRSSSEQDPNGGAGVDAGPAARTSNSMQRFIAPAGRVVSSSR